jgi:hypothetical protein
MHSFHTGKYPFREIIGYSAVLTGQYTWHGKCNPPLGMNATHQHGSKTMTTTEKVIFDTLNIIDDNQTTDDMIEVIEFLNNYCSEDN